ncbi:MAG: fasciclin domain-containing protein [Planctomycetota bacterium]
MRNLKLMLLMALFLLPTQIQGQTIARFLADNGGAFDDKPTDYDILRRAVGTAGLVDALQNREAKLTLFAPNDRAFTRLARDLGFEGVSDEQAVWRFLVQQLTLLGEGDPIGPLTNILLYHVAPTDIDIVDFINAQEVVTLFEGSTFEVSNFVRIVDKDPEIKNARLFSPLNVKYSNGTVHGISRVLLPLDL